MINKFISLILILVSIHCAYGIPGNITPEDFKAMLRTPTASFASSKNFATTVTQPFVNGQNKDLSFFSKPHQSYSTWNRLYQATAKQNLSAVTMFETMGISRQGLLASYNSQYTDITQTQATGMINLMKGDLGFQKRPCTPEEEKVVVYNLLNIGRTLTEDELTAEISQLEAFYHAIDNPAIKQHLQFVVLLLLSGGRQAIDAETWYLKGLQNPATVLQKIDDYNRLFFPIADATVLKKEAHYVDLISQAELGNWRQVQELLKPFLHASEILSPEIGALCRLADYYTHPLLTGGTTNQIFKQDQQTVTRIARRLGITAKAPSQMLQDYLDQSRILSLYIGTEKTEIRQILERAITQSIVNNNNQWPGSEHFKIAEQFFWNLFSGDAPGFYHGDKKIVPLIFATQQAINWQDFKNFYQPYLAGVRQEEKRRAIKDLFEIHQAFSTGADRAAFLEFCRLKAAIGLDNTPQRMKALLPVYQNLPTKKQKADFSKFYNPYLFKLNVNSRDEHELIKDLFQIYQAFPIEIEREAFERFCQSALGTAKNSGTLLLEFNIPQMKALVPIYQVLPTPEEKTNFLAQFRKYLPGIQHTPHMENTLQAISDFYSFYRYQSYASDEEREFFLAFCKPFFMAYDSESEKTNKMRVLFPIYNDLLVPQEREEFLAFHGRLIKSRKSLFSQLRAVLFCFQAFATQQQREEFLDFCNPFIRLIPDENIAQPMQSLLPSFLGQKIELQEFLRLHRLDETGTLRPETIASIMKSYTPRNYLRYMRVKAALKAESSWSPRRIATMYEEISLEDPLSVLFQQDRNLQRARNAQGNTANAHDFDAVFERDRLILWEQTTHSGYTPKKSLNTYILYHNQTLKDRAYATNTEVEDFINYLDNTIANGSNLTVTISRNLTRTLTGRETVSIIKQMLGLEKKHITTTGIFAPYLSSTMYFANPDAPLGDEMLGRTWFYIKNLPNRNFDTTPAQKTKDLEDYKKSVILAILDAAEISSTSADTHCQTRVTGELMKFLSWHLPKSNLRPLIAAEDLPPATTDADIETRIISASFRAGALFERLKQEDTEAIRALIENYYQNTGQEPPLWKREEAYYDALYRRTKGVPDDGYQHDINGYRLDDSILTRDEQGNLVRKYNRDGSQRPRPEIVYYQAEFQVLEKAFTDLMREEFEEKRGLKY